MNFKGFMDKQYIYNAWEKLTEGIRAEKDPNLLNFYVHFPYCQSNCDYCIYPSTELKSKDQISDYIEYLKSEMELFAPLFKGLKFKCLSIGGGTPSLMTTEQLKDLVSTIFEHYEFEQYGEKSIEFNPITTTPEKLDLMDSFGFNKLSIGVQTLSPRVLKIIDRSYQTIEKIKETITHFKKTNIGFMNVDLLIGLRGDTAEEFLYTFNEILKMEPNLLCIYPMKTNDKYIGKRYGTTKKFLDFYYPLFDAVTKELPAIAEKNNYTHYDDPSKLSYVHPIDFSLKNMPRRDVRYYYSNFKVEPYSTLGFGYYAESCINNFARYICVDPENPTTLFLKKFSTDKDVYRYAIHAFADKYSEVKFIVHQTYEHFAILRKDYKEMFKRDVVDDFPYAIKALEHLGIIEVDDDKVKFNVKNERETYAYLLFFTGRHNVGHKVNAYISQLRDKGMVQ